MALLVILFLGLIFFSFYIITQIRKSENYWHVTRLIDKIRDGDEVTVKDLQDLREKVSE